MAKIPEGIYELYVEAHDLAGNVAMSNTVTIYVGQNAPPTSGSGGGSDGGGSDGGGGTGGGTSAGDGGGSGGGSGSASGGGGTDSSSPNDALPPDFGGGSPSTGCGCTSHSDVGGRGWSVAALLGLSVLGFRRRRD